MVATNIPLTALSGSVELPLGIDFKVDSFDVQEVVRVKDGEGLIDAGFGVAVPTGRSLKGKITGSMTANQAGIADPNLFTLFNDAAFTFTFGSGQTIAGNCCVSGFRTLVKVGEITSFECDFESVGPYTSAWPAS